MEPVFDLFIHHDPEIHEWIIPYYKKRRSVLCDFVPVVISGKDFIPAYIEASRFFGIVVESMPGNVEMSDWIRCHYLLRFDRFLYSDSDVIWWKSPELSHKPKKGDTTFGIMWNGFNGLSNDAREYAFAYAKKTGMQKCINSNFLIPIDSRMDSRCFMHCKPADSNEDLMGMIGVQEL